MKLVLASGSPRRRELMHRCGLEYELLKVDVDESYEAGEPSKIVEMLSKRKAEAAKELLQGKCGEDIIIVCADTMVAADGEILGKPKDRKDAGRMIRLLQGRTHQVYTGVTLMKINGGEDAVDQKASCEITSVTFSEKTDVIVRAMTEEEIAAYVETGESDDKAGAYAIQGIFSEYIQEFVGDYDNVVGLPVKRLCMELRKLGYAAPMPIHMVVTDIDGTLVKDSSPEIYPEMIDAIRKLRKMGILFCIATGRQYYSVRHMFQEVADDIIYLCENGAHVVYNGQDLHMKEMKGDIVRELLLELRQYEGNTEVSDYLSCVAPGFAVDLYQDVYGIIRSADKDAIEDFDDAVTETFEDLFDDAADEFGDDYKLSFEIRDAERLDDRDIKDIEDAYEDLFDMIDDNIDYEDEDIYEDLADELEDSADISLSSSQVRKLQSSVESFMKSLENFKVQDAYEVKVRIVMEGEDDNYKETLTFYVIKVNGDWFIDPNSFLSAMGEGSLSGNLNSLLWYLY